MFKHTIYLLILTSFGFSCSKHCDDKKIGETYLSNKTISYLNYMDGANVVYMNSKGEKRSLIVSRKLSTYQICQEIICDPIDPYKNATCEYIEAPLEEIFLQTDSLLLGIEASVFAYEPYTEKLYDAVRFTVSHVNSFIFASVVTDVKFDESFFDQSAISDIEHFTTHQHEVILNGIPYDHIEYYQEGNMELYYQENKGFLAFIIDGELWVEVR